jgi:hypothetical protein
MLIAVLLVLTACSESIGSVEPPVLADPPEEFTKECSRPVLLPNGPLTQSEVENLWIQDRNHLISCGMQLQALIDFFESRDKRITD